MPEKKKVLLVEDNRDHAELTKIALRRHIRGVDVVQAFSASDCLTQLDLDDFDAIILDYSLPREKTTLSSPLINIIPSNPPAAV